MAILNFYYRSFLCLLQSNQIGAIFNNSLWIRVYGNDVETGNDEFEAGFRVPGFRVCLERNWTDWQGSILCVLHKINIALVNNPCFIVCNINQTQGLLTSA